jgi:hypothetical protein
VAKAKVAMLTKANSFQIPDFIMPSCSYRYPAYQQPHTTSQVSGMRY